MNEDSFNGSLRGFLKKVGITSQREIEKAVRDAVASGKLKGNEKLPAKMVLTIGGVSLTHEISGEIELCDNDGFDASGTVGVIRFTNLSFGDYTVTETQAPAVTAPVEYPWAVAAFRRRSPGSPAG